jgi:hypothetical protein
VDPETIHDIVCLDPRLFTSKGVILNLLRHLMYHKVVHYCLIECNGHSNLTFLATYSHRNLRSVVCIIWPLVPTCQKILLLALLTVAFLLPQIARDIKAIWIEANLAVAGQLGLPSTPAFLPPEPIIVTHFVLFLFCTWVGWSLDIWSMICCLWKLEVGSWRLEVGGWKLEVGSWRLRVGGWKLDHGLEYWAILI